MQSLHIHDEAWIEKCLVSRLDKHVAYIIDKGENMLVCSGLISIALTALLRQCYVKILFKTIDVTCSFSSVTYSYYGRLTCTFVYLHIAVHACSAMVCFAI